VISSTCSWTRTFQSLQDSIPRGLTVASVSATSGRLTQRSSDGTPDWYLYLRAEEARFNALVTRDWRQSAQAEEMWALTRTQLSVVTWADPINDAVAEWGQLLAYMSEILKLIDSHGNCVVLLPHPRLNKRNVIRASEALGVLASDEGRSNNQVRNDARTAINAWLRHRGEIDRFADMLGIA
jgi:hypothetical protein